MARPVRGVVPRDFKRRLDTAVTDVHQRAYVRHVARGLEGQLIEELDDRQIEALADTKGLSVEQTRQCLGVLTHCGYGVRPTRKPRSQRQHGSRLKDQYGNTRGKLPRSLAVRLPTHSSNNRRDEGPVEGEDIYGKISATERFESDDLGLLAALGGLFTARADRGDQYCYATVGSIASLTQRWKARGGRDLAHVQARLAALSRIVVSASVNPGRYGDGNDAFEIPEGTPLDSVERRHNGKWIPLDKWAERDDLADEAEFAVENAEMHLRVLLAPHTRSELEAEHRSPVFIDLRVWRHLRPWDRRLYAFLQGRSQDVPGKLYFFLADAFVKVTLGRQDGRIDRVAASIRHSLGALVKADQRYRSFGQYEQPNTREKGKRVGIPAFSVSVRYGQASMPERWLLNQETCVAEARRIEFLAPERQGERDAAREAIRESLRSVDNARVNVSQGGEVASQAAQGSRGSPVS